MTDAENDGKSENHDNTGLSVWFSILLICIVILLNGLYYPQFYVISDEGVYLLQADYLARGEMGDVNHFMYPVGYPLVLAPWFKLGFKYTFVLNGLLFILGSFLFAGLLHQLKLPLYYSALFILNPSMVLFSRTLMSEMLSVFAILLGVNLYLLGQKKKVYAYSSFYVWGLACLVKYFNAMVLLAFAVVYAIKNIRNRKWIPVLGMVVWAFIGLLPVFIQNAVMFGRWLGMGYVITDLITPARILAHLLDNLLVLNIHYPLMLILCLFYKGKYRAEFLAAVFMVFVFLLFYMFGVQGNNLPEQCILGIRFFLPVLPIMFLMYADVLEKIRKKILPGAGKIVYVTGIILLVAACFMVVKKHYGATVVAAEIKEIIYDTTEENSFVICNIRAEEYLNPVFGYRERLTFHFKDDLRDIMRRIPGSLTIYPSSYVVYYFKNVETDPVRIEKTSFDYDEQRDRKHVEELKTQFNLTPLVYKKIKGTELYIFRVEP